MNTEPLQLAEPLRLTEAQWPLVAAAWEGAELPEPGRTALVAAGVYEADGRAFTAAASAALAGLGRAQEVIAVRTCRPEQVADLDVFLAPGASTTVERLGDQLLVSGVQTSVVPVRVARQLGIGPRPPLGSTKPLRVPVHLGAPLFAGDHAGVVAVIDRLVEAFAINEVAVADALEAGDWRASALTAVVGQRPVAGLVLLDTRAGLFMVGPVSDEAETLIPTRPSELWARLARVTTLDAEGRPAILAESAGSTVEPSG